MGLKNLALQLERKDIEEAPVKGLTEVEDSFDAPMMIMNQIHEA